MGEHFKPGNNLVINVIFTSTPGEAFYCLIFTGNALSGKEPGFKPGSSFKMVHIFAQV